MIIANKLILVKICLQKVDLGEDYTQKVKENFKKHSTSDTIGGPLLMSHPVKTAKKHFSTSYLPSIW